MADNRYANAKCFVFSPDGYQEITYEELCRRREIDTNYQNRKFIPLHGMLMEVTADTYRDFYKDKRRQKYLYEQSVKSGDISYDMLTTDEFSGASILIDDSVDVAARAENKIMMDKLKQAVLTLTDDEQLLLYRHYYAEISETELASLYGISQQAISKRISKIRAKLKKIIEN